MFQVWRDHQGTLNLDLLVRKTSYLMGFCHFTISFNIFIFYGKYMSAVINVLNWFYQSQVYSIRLRQCRIGIY